ncbi:hypothetical protein AALA21_02260 [Eggerthellaceae bacterium 3-80]
MTEQSLQKTYQFSRFARLLQVHERVLADAVPRIPKREFGTPDMGFVGVSGITDNAESSSAQSLFGWLAGGIAMPATGGCYAVEFLPDKSVRVLAYLDTFGRAFVMDEATIVPPARRPDMQFVGDDPDRPFADGTGNVYVRDAEGEVRDVVCFRREKGRYSFFDSWYDFGEHGEDLSYNSAMARAFFAFVYRPSQGAPQLPKRGLDGIFQILRTERPLKAMEAILRSVEEAQTDPLLQIPPLVLCLAEWLKEAGIEVLQKAHLADDALRLVRTIRYANTYFLALDDEDAKVPPSYIWALESALNRFLLVAEALGDRASRASEEECLRWDGHLIETIALQQPELRNLADAPIGPVGSEWDVRCAISSAIERLRLPYRISIAIREDLAAGAVAFNIVTPDESIMPAYNCENVDHNDNPIAKLNSEQDRQNEALRYAMHIGLLLAAIAFEATEKIVRVDIVARSLRELNKEYYAREGSRDVASLPALYDVTFERNFYDEHGEFESGRAGNPRTIFDAAGARYDVDEADAFTFIKSHDSYTQRREAPEAFSQTLDASEASVLGVTGDSCDMRIMYDGARRRFAEKVSDEVVHATSTTDAIRLVRIAQEKATADNDERAVSGCIRLMAALTEGSIDAFDQNAIVSCILGEDRCLTALGKANALADSGEYDQAVEVLIDAVAESAALDGFTDGLATVYRTFDSYASRLIYNLARKGELKDPRSAQDDVSKRVELAPDSYYLCCLEIVRLLEHSFERTDDALRYGQQSLALGPATGAGYRQLGRAFMLVGDMENAAKTLLSGLEIMVQPNDIAMAYYQLAYVFWKQNRYAEGALCYVKSIMTSSIIAPQASAELQELMEEAPVILPERDGIDEALEQSGIVVAPTESVLDALGSAIVAAVDAGLFPVARNLLAIRLRYRPDDALMAVLISLED